MAAVRKLTLCECRCSGVKKSHSQPEFSHFAVSLHVQKKEREKKEQSCLMVFKAHARSNRSMLPIMLQRINSWGADCRVFPLNQH